MKIICNLPDRQLQKVLILSGASDSEAEKVSKALPNYPELDITDFLEKNDSDKSARFALAAFALAAIAEIEDH